MQSTLLLRWTTRLAVFGLLAAIMAGAFHPFRVSRFAAAEDVPLLLPMRGAVEINGFLPDGIPGNANDHDGLDLYAVDMRSADTNVYPTAPGKIVFSGWNCQTKSKQPPCYGYTVAIDHGNGLYSIYAHLAESSIPANGVEDSLFVNYTTVIGTMSDSGCEGCGGAHLHFAVRRGPAGLTGIDALFATSQKSENVWGVIDGLPGQPARTRIDRTATHDAPGGVWVSPTDNNQTVTGRRLTLRARAYPSKDSEFAVAYVNFTMAWAGGKGHWRLACPPVTVPVDGDTYECIADLPLIRDVPNGQVTVSFDVYDRDGVGRLAPNGTHTVILKPGDVLGANFAAPGDGPIPPYSDIVIAALEDDPASDSGTPEPVVIAVGDTVAVNQADVVLRSSPSTAAEPVATVSEDDPLIVFSDAQTVDGTTWWPVQVIATGVIGFVEEGYLVGGGSTQPPLTLTEDEVRAEVIEAVNAAGSYRWEQYTTDESGSLVLFRTGDVDLDENSEAVLSVDGRGQYHVGFQVYSQYAGSWQTWESQDPAISELAWILKQLVTPSSEYFAWVLNRQDSLEGRVHYILRFEDPQAGGKLVDELWIDGTTLLPSRFHRENLVNHYVSDTKYFDWGADIQIILPDAALNIPPTPTPTPPNPLTSSSVHELSASLIDALIAGDFERVRGFYAPDRQPSSWCDVTSTMYYCDYYDEGGTAAALFEQCAGVPYEIVIRESRLWNGVDFAHVIILFETSCALDDDYDPACTGCYVLAPFDRLEFGFERSTGYWYIDNIVP